MEFLDRVLWEPIAVAAALIIDKRAGLIARALRRLFRRRQPPLRAEPLAVDVQISAAATAPTASLNVEAADVA